jgi:hypothetical protein
MLHTLFHLVSFVCGRPASSRRSLATVARTPADATKDHALHRGAIRRWSHSADAAVQGTSSPTEVATAPRCSSRPGRSMVASHRADFGWAVHLLPGHRANAQQRARHSRCFLVATPVVSFAQPVVRRMRRLLRFLRPLSVDASFMRSELDWTRGAEDPG